MDITNELKFLIESSKIRILCIIDHIIVLVILDMRPGEYMLSDNFNLEDTLPAIDVMKRL